MRGNRQHYIAFERGSPRWTQHFGGRLCEKSDVGIELEELCPSTRVTWRRVDEDSRRGVLCTTSAHFGSAFSDDPWVQSLQRMTFWPIPHAIHRAAKACFGDVNCSRCTSGLPSSSPDRMGGLVVEPKFARVRLGSGQPAERVNQQPWKPGEREERCRRRPGDQFHRPIANDRRDAVENQSHKTIDPKGASTGCDRQQPGRETGGGMELAHKPNKATQTGGDGTEVVLILKGLCKMGARRPTCQP